jgi:hypothetical protein
MKWKCGRLIAMAVIGGPSAIFNYDFAAYRLDPGNDRARQIENWVKFRHIALTTLSLMCEAMAGVPVVITSPSSPRW